MDNNLSVLSGELTSTCWSPDKNMPFDLAEDVSRTLETIEYATPFWIGDWLNYAEETFGERYAQLVPDGKEESWRSYKWVCSRVAPAIRQRLTGYTQARCIAKLAPDEQEALLQGLDPTALTTRDLGDEVKRLNAPPAPPRQEAEQDAKPDDDPAPNKDPAPAHTPVKPNLTWGLIKMLAEQEFGLEHEQKVIINIGPGATNITLHEREGYFYLEGWADHDGPALCRE